MPEYTRHPNTKCNICNNPIYRRPCEISKRKNRVYCSPKCYGVSCRKEEPCVECGTLILAGANKLTCSRACANKHRKGIKYNGSKLKDKVVYQKGIKERLLKSRGRCCEACKYDNFKILETHHIDRDRKNNEMKNLRLLCPNCHAEEHSLV